MDLHRVTQAVLDRMKDAILRRDPVADRLIDAAIADLRRSVEAEGIVVPERAALVKEIRESFEKGAVATEKVNSDNDVEALLDENAELKLRTPYNVFIGGQILDRGITVPNCWVAKWAKQRNCRGRRCKLLKLRSCRSSRWPSRLAPLEKLLPQGWLNN